MERLAERQHTRMDAALAASLHAALAFFDLFSHPSTLMELVRLRYGREGTDAASGRASGRASGGERGANDQTEAGDPAAAEVLRTLSEDPRIEQRDGFYFLRGRGATVERRKRAYRIAEPKFRKALRAARWLRWLPSVRMVAVCNSLALADVGERSDIDLFVVARPGTLWVTRLLAVGALAATGQRPRGDDHADKVCMSFFVAENAMDLSSVALPGGDPYLAYWIATLVPVYDAGGVADALFAANAWVGERLPGVHGPVRPAARRRVAPAPRWTAVMMPLLRACERAAKALQSRRFPRAIRMMMNRDSRVVVTDAMLKFHVNDRRAEFARMFRERAGIGAAPSVSDI